MKSVALMLMLEAGATAIGGVILPKLSGRCAGTLEQERIMEKIELTAEDVGNLIRAVRAFPAAEPVLVPVIDPVTGVVVGWVWKIPDPHPLDKIDYSTIPNEAVEALKESVDVLEASASPVQLLLASADLLEHRRKFAIGGCVPFAETMEGQARRLMDLGLSRLA